MRCTPRPEGSESSAASTGRAAVSHEPGFPWLARALPVGMHRAVPFFEEAVLMMELPKRHATSLYGQPVRTHSATG